MNDAGTPDVEFCGFDDHGYWVIATLRDMGWPPMPATVTRVDGVGVRRVEPLHT